MRRKATGLSPPTAEMVAGLPGEYSQRITSQGLYFTLGGNLFEYRSSPNIQLSKITLNLALQADFSLSNLLTPASPPHLK